MIVDTLRDGTMPLTIIMNMARDLSDITWMHHYENQDAANPTVIIPHIIVSFAPTRTYLALIQD